MELGIEVWGPQRQQVLAPDEQDHDAGVRADGAR